MRLKHSSLRLVVICGAIATSAACTGPTPSLIGLGAYDEVSMPNYRTQYYGETHYTFEVACYEWDTVISRSSSADAVWFDYEVVLNGTQDIVTIEPDQDGNWSAKVTFRCNKPSTGYLGEPVIANFCFMGPCANTDKP